MNDADRPSRTRFRFFRLFTTHAVNPFARLFVHWLPYFALISYRGRKTGKRYTIPVSYERQDDNVTVITKRARTWWHNFETPIEVELRLSGRMYTGKAEIQTDDAATLEFMTDFLARRPVDAKAYGLARN